MEGVELKELEVIELKEHGAIEKDMIVVNLTKGFSSEHCYG